MVGEAGDGAEAQELVAGLRPDVLVLDLVMPGPKPSDVEHWVRRHYPEIATLILTAHDRDVFRSTRLTANLAEVEEAGAAGFLTKDEDAPALAGNRRLHAIRRAARGEVLYTQKQLERARRWRQEVGKRWKRLTGREREVLRLVVEGETNREIAKTLCIAKTVEKHVSNVLDKLEMESRTEAAVWAVKNELVE